MVRKFSFVVVVILTLSLLLSPFGLSFTANAQEITAEGEINALLDELMKNKALSLLKEDEKTVRNCESEISKVEQELEAMGVKKLSNQEVTQFFAEKNISNTRGYVTKPTNTNTVIWYLYNDNDYVYNSKTYDIQRLYAIENNPGGTLVTGADNIRLYSGESQLANAISTACSIYVQKAIGTIPVIGWTPYELLFSSSSSNAFNTGYLTYRCVSSISFTYVKEASQSNDSYQLTYLSNKATLAANVHGAAVINSLPDTYSEEETVTITADNFSSIPAAIRSFIGTGSDRDYIYWFDVKCLDGEYTKRINLPTASVGPGQIQ